MTSLQPSRQTPSQPTLQLTPSAGTLRQPRIQPRLNAAPAALSSRQQQLWYLYQLNPTSPAYNVAFLLHLNGDLDRTVLEQSLNEIVRRHDALRTRITPVADQVLQVIAPAEPLHLTCLDLSDRGDGEAQLHPLIQTEVRRAFDLEHEPLIRFLLIKLAHDRHALFFNLHHIIADQWSVQILLHELVTIYPAFARQEPSPLPELTVQYGDCADWQRQQLQGDSLKKLQHFWQEQLQDAPNELALPTDFPHTRQTFSGSVHPVQLSPQLVKDLTRLGRSCKATPFMVMMAALQTLLHRYSHQTDIVVGFPIAARSSQEMESVIGYFANTLALRTSFADNPTVRDLLYQVKAAALGAYTHQALPFEKVVEVVNPRRDECRNPIFQTLLVLQNMPLAQLQLSGVALRLEQLHNGTAKFDLSLELHEAEGGLKGWFEYRTDLFEPATIERMVGHFQTLLEGMVADPNQPIAALPLLTAAERQQLLVEWNHTQTAYPQDKCIHQLFEEQVERTPDAIAVVFADQHLTYRELNHRANQLAHYLQSLGVSPEVLVGICIERSLEMVVGLLGILKAGGAYVPLDPGYPLERLAFMLDDAQVFALLTSQELVNQLPEYQGHLLCLDRDWENISQANDKNLESGIQPENLAYVIYTSGSTGKPKGVQVLHRGVVNFLSSMEQQPGINSEDILLSVTTLSFDIAVLEIFLPLTVGAQVVLVSREAAMDGRKLSKSISELGITIMQATPATWRLLLEAKWRGNQKMKILSGGEAISRELAAELLDKGAELWNLYGPTETTIWSSVYQVKANERRVSIGRPIANTEIYILDSLLQPVPVGVAGELHIGGAGLAKGYLNRPDLTGEKYIPNPFNETEESRIYKTSDLARYLPNGNIECLGRLDFQVKIRGFRIELGEIESVLVEHPTVQQCVVIAREDEPGIKHLVAYVVSTELEAFTPKEFRQFLRQTLPDYMLPSAFVQLDFLPLTPNGKVNRRALPEPEVSNLVASTNYVAPRTSVEQALAQIWAEMLKLEQVGIHDNFFELGGHSLLAVSLFTRLDRAFNLHLPLATLFKAPTIEALAQEIASEGPSDSAAISFNQSLIPIQPYGHKHPLFCVHGGGGNPLVFQRLAQQLDLDQPLYALQLPGLDGLSPPYQSVAEMATAYLREVQQVQPRGPYSLGGFSFGGVVAYEMAQQLQAQGHTVAQVVLFDTSILRTAPSLRNRSRQVWQQVQQSGWRRLPLLLASLNQFLTWRFRWALARTARSVFRWLHRPLPHHWQKDYAVETCERLVNIYQPQPYSGSVLLFHSTLSNSPFEEPLMARWRRLVGDGLSTYPIAVEHVELLNEAAVEQIAPQLQACLDAAILQVPVVEKATYV